MVNRTNKNKFPYFMVDNRASDDLNLSNGAFGLLCRLLRNKDNWTYTEELLCRKTNTNIFQLRSQIKELISNMYLQRKRVYVNGRFSHYDYIINEFPNNNSII